MTRDEAQARADRVRAFQDELGALEQEGALALAADQRARVAAHHAALLAALTAEHDIDATGGQKQLSWGMRIVAFLGAVAFSAAVWFLFYRYWGYLGVPVQVAVLAAAPLVGVGATELAARRDRSGTFATITALVALAAFVLDLSMLGQIFDVTPSQHAFLVWAAFALFLAYAHGLRLLLVAGLCCLLAWLSASAGTFGGIYWISAGERPETVIAGGLVLFGLSFVPHRVRTAFPAAYRITGLLAVLVAILILADWGNASALPLSRVAAEHLYQVAGFAASAAVILLGVRRGWPGTANLGSTAFTIFLYTKLYDWWWEWMPRYLFFLVLGLVATLLLLVLRRLRAASQAVRAAAEVAP
ncbi:MAG: DUF2157 domain-containing protein [Anaeromyxobacter sp.]